MSEKNVEIVGRSIVAYNRRDFETLQSLNHADVELDWSASRGLEAGVYQGRETVMAFYENFFETFATIEIEPDRFIDSGDLVVVPNTAQTRGRDGIATVARSALLFEVSGGSIVRICLYQDTPSALEAAGMSER
jgi:ketosteroid isomerase-like protein